MSAGPWPARIVWLSAAVRIFAAAGCSGGETPLGAADAYLLFAPVEPAARSAPGGLPVVDRLEPDGAAGQLLNKLFADGFAAEMVRTVHLAKQLVRNGTLEGRRYGEPLREEALEPLCLVVGLEGTGPRPHGLAVARWLRSPLERDSTVWLGLPASFAEDKAAVQTVTGRLAAHAISWVDGAAGDSAAGLPEAYRMAMEVIAREWRVGRGPSGAMATTAGTEVQRRLFAEIRENRAVLASEGKALRPPSELLADPRVAATVIYRLAQQRTVAQAVAAPETYIPFVVGPLPEGVSGAAVLGPIRNFQAKLFTAWGRGVLAGRPPRDIVDLVEAYTRAFPSERSEVLRVFLVTTYLGTVKPGGMSRQPERAEEALAEVGTVLAEVVAGKRGLRDALNAPPAAPPAAAPTAAPRRRR
jgi:hypothetical protein